MPHDGREFSAEDDLTIEALYLDRTYAEIARLIGKGHTEDTVRRHASALGLDKRRDANRRICDLVAPFPYYKSIDEVTMATGLSRYQVRRAARILGKRFTGHMREADIPMTRDQEERFVTSIRRGMTLDECAKACGVTRPRAFAEAERVINHLMDER